MRKRSAHSKFSGYSPRIFPTALARGSTASRHRRPLVALLIAAALMLIPSVMAPSALAATSHPRHTSAASTPLADQIQRASADAKATGKSVPVDALTTATSTTRATPRGTFVETQTLQPTRVKRGRSWVNLDARLHRNSDGTLSPNATSSRLVISGGGADPLVTIADGGVGLSLYWPTRLPRPALHGAAATYPGVLPGVDLVVTATPRGGFSHVLVVKTRAAAANPALAHLSLRAHGDGLSVAADSHGALSASTRAGGPAIFTAKPAIMWDSATTAPAAPASTVPSPDLPEASGITEPGEAAHTMVVKTTVHQAFSTRAGPTTAQRALGDAVITLTPDAGLLAAKSTAFPVYIDPTWNPQFAGGSRQAWASVSSALPGNTEYDNSYDPNANVLQVGYVDGFKARSFIRFGVSSVLKGATIYSSDVKFTTDNDGDEFCHASGETDLWWTGGISKSTSWNNQPSWTSKIDGATADNCPNHSVDFDATSFMQAHGTSGMSTLTLGLRAPDEGTDTEWEEFYSGKGEAGMSTEYDRPPGLGRIPSSSPGGLCQTGVPSLMTIGSDDVTFSVVPNDPDGGQLGTEFVILDYGTSNIVYPTGSDTGTVTTTSGTTARLVLKRSTIEGWKTDGATKAYNYSWYVVTSDGKLNSPGSGAGTSGSRCHFTYDPTAPVEPGLQEPTGTLTLGQDATAALAPCADALADPPVACAGTPPARYFYQVNETTPVLVNATGSPQSITIPLHHVGPNQITVYALSAGGNPGPIASATFTVNGPTTPYIDGDINGDNSPDLVTNATGDAGLWLATSNGDGTLATPTDIGGLGTGINTNGSPADWTGAQILHGDFTGNHVQDTVAYYPTGPSAGNADLLFGNGDTTALSPYVGSQQQIAAPGLADLNGDNPTQLVAAGNASLQGNLVPDLIGITGDATNGYELDLYTSPDGLFGDYSDIQPLTAPNQTPDATGWNNYTLAAAQPGGQPVLFALNTATGQMYESTNPGQDPSTPIGSPGTWTQLTVPWTTAPKLVSADVNSAGQVELWTESGMTATTYTLTGTTIAQQAINSLIAPDHEWPLTSSSGATSSCSATLCTPDTSGGADIPATSGVTFPSDPTHGTVASFDGTGYLTAPQNMLESSNTLTLTLSFRADPGTNGILFSTGNDTPDKANPSATPVMYIGTDGRLYAQFWNGSVTPMTSPQPVNDGQWHTATLNAYDAGGGAYHQGLYLDNLPRIGMEGSSPVNNKDPLNYIGAGVFSHNTSTRTWINAPGDTTKDRASYFTGQISDVAYYARYVSSDQLAAWWQPVPLVGPIVSSVASALCIDDADASTTDKNKIQIHTCNNTPAQNWSINPGGTEGTISMTLNGITKCMDVASAGTTDGTLVQLYTCNGTPAQDWHLDSSGQIWNPNSGKCLDDPDQSTTNGTQLQIYTCNLTAAQNWILP